MKPSAKVHRTSVEFQADISAEAQTPLQTPTHSLSRNMQRMATYRILNDLSPLRWLGFGSSRLAAPMTFSVLNLLIFATLLATANSLSYCPNGCECDDDNLVVKCGEGTLDVLPIALNPSIRRLAIKNNKIRTIDSSIQFYAELTFLDLSYNDLMTIPPRTFLYQRKLQEVHFNHNKIGQINNKTFVGLVSVVVLNLRGNLIAELEDYTFQANERIEELNLGENRISTIAAHAFDGLTSLRVLFLDDNTLTTMPAAMTFQAMPALAELFLGTNSFTKMPEACFQSLQGLTRLDLRGAGLVDALSEAAFAGLDNLRYLDLSDNRLQDIPSQAFKHLARVEELLVGQNEYATIKTGAFAGLKNLRKLHITGAQYLQKVESNAFIENTNLEFLNLSINRILSEIEENAFSGLPHLKHLILKENNLNTLLEGLIPWSDLQTFDISDNPIVCDCRVLWLRNLLLERNSSAEQSPTNGDKEISRVTCMFPETLHGESLSQQTPSRLGCSATDSKTQAMIGVIIVGVTVIISAIVFIICGCRRRIREVLKGKNCGWGNSPLGRKESEYQKTFSDDEYVTRQQQHPCLGLGIHAGSTALQVPSVQCSGRGSSCNMPINQYPNTRPIPVTEL